MLAIEIENLSKQYALGKIGTSTLARDLNVWWARMRGKPNPYLKIGQTNDRSQKANGDFVWALKDINFKVEEGDVVGIIGKNGAGKSTLLKILSRITTPTTGRITTYGRVASLLEVGTGFHGEMTGRENIYMNGSIMGMTKQEIDRKLDEIVDFAGVEKYIDTPVKRYSSGMTVRLGFAVAAFLEPEILIVDEVLAVGDAEFQKKAIGKMQDVSRGDGRTVLFVSHNMASVKYLCNNGIVLKDGMINYVGTADDCVNHYLENNIDTLVCYSNESTLIHEKTLGRELEYLSIQMLNDNHNVASTESLIFELVIRKNVKNINKCQFGAIAYNISDEIIWTCYSSPLDIEKADDVIKIRYTIHNHNTPMGRHKMNFNISYYDYTANIRDYDIVYDSISFEITHIDQGRKHPFTLWPFESGTSIHTSSVELA